MNLKLLLGHLLKEMNVLFFLRFEHEVNFHHHTVCPKFLPYSSKALKL